MSLAYRLHHVGVAVPSIDEYLPKYLGFSGKVTSPKILDPIQNVWVQFLTQGTDVAVELIEPVDEKSPVSNFLKKHGPGLNHLCYVVSDIETACAEVRKQGGIVTCRPVKAVAFHDKRIAFAFFRDLGIIEFVEEPGEYVQGPEVASE